MLNAPQQPSDVICTHERRPGTTVCLHCRHAARIATRAKRKRLVLRGGAAVIVIATFIAAGALGATAIRGKVRRSSEVATVATSTVAEVGAQRDSASPAATGATTPAPPVALQGEPSARVSAPISPVLPGGESPMADGLVAVRADSGVMLSFDTPLARTRIPEKFEQLVRRTLPEIYGRSVDSVLAKLPQGAIAKQGDLTTQLPIRGVRIPIGPAWMFMLYPETRPGQDGPLVVRYRVSVVPAQGV